MTTRTTRETTGDRLGFIGLGNMGWPMAANLARAGHQLVVRDADTGRQDAFAQEFGARKGNNPDAFADVNAVFTMLPNGATVRSALIDDGIAAGLPVNTLVIESSSSEPLATLALGDDLASVGLRVVDAPVSGGMARALDGTLSIMLGANNRNDAEEAERILQAVSSKIFRTGALGSGHTMKALNNFVLGAGFVAAAEALVMGEKFGLGRDTIVEVLNASSGRNVSTETTLVTEILSGRYAANFSLGLFSKDLGIAADLSKSLDIDSPVCEAVSGRLASAAAELGPQADYTKAHALWAKSAGLKTPST